MRVLIQLRHTGGLHEAATALAPSADSGLTAALTNRNPGLQIDPSFAPVQLPGMAAGASPAVALTEHASFDLTPEASTYLVRGAIPDDEVGRAAAMGSALANAEVVGVFADPAVATCPACPGSPPVGTSTEVSAQLDVPALSAAGLDGSGVAVAIVDTGTNVKYLSGVGVNLLLDAANSWAPGGVIDAPGTHAVGHGTMCAYDAAIAAPQATLLDHALLLSSTPGSTVMSGFLSDAIVSYSRLIAHIQTQDPADRALVVSNSWGMFDPEWDFPVGHPGNYSDNLRHPFNLIVRSLAAAGADIIFAAGNCGRDCPDGRCNFGTGLPICGANSHPSVISVAGVDVERTRVGYSSQGPGRLSVSKPSLCGYTHFTGSGVFGDVDGGTSAACPTIAGLVAAVRTRIKASRLSPSQLRTLLFKTADDLGIAGYDFDHGWGVPNTAVLLARLEQIR